MEHLGAPVEVLELTGSPVPRSPVQALNVAYFAPAGPQSPVVFATCGAALLELKGARAEVIMLLRREPNARGFEAVQKLLSGFVVFAETRGEPIQVGDIVRAPDDLKHLGTMESLLFLPPIPFVPNFHRAPITQNRSVDLFWMLPVYAAEAAYALQHGPQALMMLFAAQSLDLTDLERDEANTLMRPEDAAAMAQKVAEEAAQKASRPVPQAAVKPKTSRRDLGRGSFGIEETGTAVRITRRGAKPGDETQATAVTAVAPAAPPEPLVAPPPPPEARPRPVSRIRPPEPLKQEVRFDLTQGAVQTTKPAPKPKVVEPPPPPPETPQEAKKKRIEALKAAAKNAAAEAAARKAAASTPELVIPTPEKDTTSQDAAARRRGAPKPLRKDE